MKQSNLIISLSLLFIFFYSCKKEKDITEEQGKLAPVGNIKYTDKTVIIDNQTNTNLVESDSTKLVFNNSSEKIQNIKTGDILISGISKNAANGYLRKVTGVSTSNNITTLNTEQAVLTEAITDINIDTTVVVDSSNFSQLKSSFGKAEVKGTHITFPINAILYDADGNHSTIEDQISYKGTLVTDISYSFKLKIVASEIQNFEISCNATHTITNNIEIGGSVASFNQEIPLLSFRLPPIEPSGIVIVPYLRIYIGAEGQINETISIEQSTTLTTYTGLKKENGTWTPFSEKTLSGNITFSGINIEAFAKAYVKPSLDIEFFDCKNAEAQLYIRGYLSFDANPSRNPIWQVYGGLDAKADFTLRALMGLIDFNVTLDIFDYSTLLASGNTNSNNQDTGTVTDYDGNVYKTIKIGNQWWIAENLKVTHYRNSVAIPNITDATSWSGLTSGAYCNYNNDISNVATYGRLYNWYTVVDSNNICPTGWHVPTDAEWTTLTDYLGGESVAGGKLKETGTTHWFSPNTGATNETGFTALPGGYRFDVGTFDYVRNNGVWWSTNDTSTTDAYYRRMYYGVSNAYRNTIPKKYGVSVRCLRD